METIPIQSLLLTGLAIFACLFGLFITMARIIKYQLKKELLLEIKRELKLN